LEYLHPNAAPERQSTRALRRVDFKEFAMQNATTKLRPRHEIVVSAADHERLTGLASTALTRLPEVAEELLSEMDRATVADSVPDNVVRMGSAVTFRSGDGQTRRITLVYPGEADIAENKVSVLTPLGTALIGLAAGQSATWITRDGRELALDVIEVEQQTGGGEP
jgi:regulator of nucleoside diphosphate kinase